MIAYKKVVGAGYREFILTLLIPPEAKRENFRNFIKVSEARVLRAEQINGGYTAYKAFYSLYDWNFVYRIGETAKSRTGIFCVLTKEEARNYMKWK